MINTLAVSGYRSLRDVKVQLNAVTVVSGPNGSGKSNFYRALRLLADVAQGRIISALAQEGGLNSTLWAGPETISRRVRSGDIETQGMVRRKPISLRLGFASDDYGYAVDMGLPQPSSTMFGRDPEIKAEALWAGEKLKRNNCFAERRGNVVTDLDKSGRRQIRLQNLASYDSMMTHAADPIDARELLDLRERMRGWRFYDNLRVDSAAPVRQPQVGTRTTALASDGSDLAAAVQTIFEIGAAETFSHAISQAFSGAKVRIEESGNLFELSMIQPGLLRPLRVGELSDGTIRFLMLAAALLTPRAPELIVLNEPEASLHPDLLLPLTELILAASKSCQIIVVSHSGELLDNLRGGPDTSSISLKKDLGETVIEQSDYVPWEWPKR